MSFVKNRYPTNTNRNPYHKNKKNSTVETPVWLAEFIFKKVNPILKKKKIKHIFDVGCYKGNLSLPFKKHKYSCCGLDYKKVKYPSTFYKCDFLNLPLTLPVYSNELIVCNPPFNDAEGKYGKQLLPELFLKQIFSLWHNKIPVVYFAPMGMLKNQRLSSPRWKWLRDCGSKITSELELPIDAYIPEGNEEKYNKAIKEHKEKLKNTAFGNTSYESLEYYTERMKRKYKIVLVHSSVLFFNIPGLPAKMFLDV